MSSGMLPHLHSSIDALGPTHELMSCPGSCRGQHSFHCSAVRLRSAAVDTQMLQCAPAALHRLRPCAASVHALPSLTLCR